MGMIRKMILLGVAKKVAGAFLKRRRSSFESSGAGPALAAHSKDAASGAKSGQSGKAAGVRSAH